MTVCPVVGSLIDHWVVRPGFRGAKFMLMVSIDFPVAGSTIGIILGFVAEGDTGAAATTSVAPLVAGTGSPQAPARGAEPNAAREPGCMPCGVGGCCDTACKSCCEGANGCCGCCCCGCRCCSTATKYPTPAGEPPCRADPSTDLTGPLRGRLVIPRTGAGAVHRAQNGQWGHCLRVRLPGGLGLLPGRARLCCNCCLGCRCCLTATATVQFSPPV
mmetsp:Transcript_20157/g.60362  ORF Transcript_20157/g.60362 Transcript_20157/m.60362 type:complete len:216 (-) Transcript_20157:61-708(-)